MVIKIWTKSKDIKLLNQDLKNQFELSEISDRNENGEVKINTWTIIYLKE